MDYLDYQKETGDSLANESEEHALRAVVSKDDLNNYYVDKTQKRLFKEVIKIKRDFKVLDLGVVLVDGLYGLLRKLSELLVQISLQT